MNGVTLFYMILFVAIRVLWLSLVHHMWSQIDCEIGCQVHQQTKSKLNRSLKIPQYLYLNND